jgi:hypothetical protein
MVSRCTSMTSRRRRRVVGTDALDLAVHSTRSLGKVSHIGLAGGSLRMKPLDTSRFEVLSEATLWGSIKELREVIALAESGRLTIIPSWSRPLCCAVLCQRSSFAWAAES